MSVSLILGTFTVLRTGSSELIIFADTSLMSFLIYSLVNGLYSALADNGLLVMRVVDVRPLE